MGRVRPKAVTRHLPQEAAGYALRANPPYGLPAADAEKLIGTRADAQGFKLSFAEAA